MNPLNPFFVVGAHRSGTTMLRLMLNSHSRLAVPFESGFAEVIPLAEQLAPLADRSNQRRLAEALSEEKFTKKGKIITDIDTILTYDISDFGSFIDAVFTEWAKRNGKMRWGVKTPGYVTEMDVLSKYFPTSQFVHIVRDGRDIALSYSRISWGTRNLARAAEEWKYKCILGRKMGRVLGPERYFELHYEELVLEPEKTLAGICEFLSEKFEPKMLDYHLVAEQEMPESSIEWHKSSVRAPDISKVLAWKRQMPLSDQILFELYAGDVLEILGYELIRHRHTLLSKLKQIYYAISSS